MQCQAECSDKDEISGAYIQATVPKVVKLKTTKIEHYMMDWEVARAV